MQTRLFFGTLLPKSGLDYAADREILGCLFAGILGREASLSEMTLGERNQVMESLIDKWLDKNARVAVPIVPKRLRTWKKDAADDGYERLLIPKSDPHGRQKRLILTLWGLLGYEPKQLHGRCQRQFGVENFVWLKDGAALQTLTKDLWSRCKRQGLRLDAA